MLTAPATTFLYVVGDGLAYKSFETEAHVPKYHTEAEDLVDGAEGRARHTRVKFMETASSEKLGWVDLKNGRPGNVCIDRDGYEDMFKYLGKGLHREERIIYKPNKKVKWEIDAKKITCYPRGQKMDIQDPFAVYQAQCTEDGVFSDQVSINFALLTEYSVHIAEILVGWWILERIRHLKEITFVQLNDSTEIRQQRILRLRRAIRRIPRPHFNLPGAQRHRMIIEHRASVRFTAAERAVYMQRVRDVRTPPAPPEAAEGRRRRDRVAEIPDEALWNMLDENGKPDGDKMVEYIREQMRDWISCSEGTGMADLMESIERRINTHLLPNQRSRITVAHLRTNIPRPAAPRLVGGADPFAPNDPFAPRAAPVRVPLTARTAGFEIDYALRTANGRYRDAAWPTDIETVGLGGGFGFGYVGEGGVVEDGRYIQECGYPVEEESDDDDISYTPYPSSAIFPNEEEERHSSSQFLTPSIQFYPSSRETSDTEEVVGSFSATAVSMHSTYYPRRVSTKLDAPPIFVMEPILAPAPVVYRGKRKPICPTMKRTQNVRKQRFYKPNRKTQGYQQKKALFDQSAKLICLGIESLYTSFRTAIADAKLAAEQHAMWSDEDDDTEDGPDYDLYSESEISDVSDDYLRFAGRFEEDFDDLSVADVIFF